MIKRYFRDVTISLILALSMALAFFLILNVIDIVNKFDEKMEHRDNINYEFNKSYIVKNSDFEDNKELVDSVVEISSMFDGIVEQNFRVGAQLGEGTTEVLDYVYVSVKDKLYLENSRSEYIVLENMEDIKGVYISEVLKEYAEVVNGKEQILINGIYFEVIDYLMDYSTDSERKVLIFWDNLSNEEKKQWIYSNQLSGTDGFILTFMSNKETAKESAESVMKTFRENGFSIESAYSEYRDNYVMSMQDPNVQMVVSMTAILLIFAFVSCFYVSGLWINKRKKELVIRKAFGFDLLDIVKVLFGDLLKISCVAVVIAIVLQYVYRSFIIKEPFWLVVSMKSIFLIAISVIYVVLISLIVPLIKVVLIKPAKGVK